jgi:leucyl-tRNA synthetase
MFMGPLEQVKPWQTSGVAGIQRFLQRTWRLVVDEESGALNPAIGDHEASRETRRALHLAIREATQGIEELRFNTPISKMMELVNTLTGQPLLPRSVLRDLLCILSPYAPHIAEELWERLGFEGRAAEQPWPAFDPAAIVVDEVDIAIQVLGRLRGAIRVPRGLDREALIEAARREENVARHLEGREIVKEIVLPDRLVNFVVR